MVDVGLIREVVKTWSHMEDLKKKTRIRKTFFISLITLLVLGSVVWLNTAIIVVRNQSGRPYSDYMRVALGGNKGTQYYTVGELEEGQQRIVWAWGRADNRVTFIWMGSKNRAWTWRGRMTTGLPMTLTLDPQGRVTSNYQPEFTPEWDRIKHK